MNRTPIRGTICTHDVDHGDVYRNSRRDPKKYKILTNSTSANLLNLCQRERAVKHKHHNGQIHNEAANGGAGLQRVACLKTQEGRESKGDLLTKPLFQTLPHLRKKSSLGYHKLAPL